MAWSEKAIEEAANTLAHKMGYSGVGHANQFRDWIVPILDAAAAVDRDAQQQTQRDVRDMSDDELTAYFIDLEKQWDRLSASLEESGGCSGSPFESLDEKIGDVLAERNRRARMK